MYPSVYSADPLTAWMFSRCRAAAHRGSAGNLWVDFWFSMMIAWAVPLWLLSTGEMLLREMVLVSRLRISGAFEGLSGVMLLMNGLILQWSTSAIMRAVLEKVLTVEMWIWSSTIIGLGQLLALRFGNTSARSIATVCAFVWWFTMAIRLYTLGLLLTHSQLIGMSGATAISLFILRFQMGTEHRNGKPKR